MRITLAAMSSQNVSDSIRGKAMRREPIMIGTSQFANGPSTPEVMIPIIIEPCMPTSVRYWLAPKTCTFGWSSSERINIAFSPPTKKNTPIPTRYWIATTLWSVLRLK